MFTPCLPEQTDGPRFPPCYNQYQKKLCCEIKYTGQPWTGPYRGSRVVWHVVVRPWPWDYCDGIGQQQGASSVRFYLNLFLRPSRSLNSFHWTRLPDRIGIVHGTGCCDTNTCTPLRCGPHYCHAVLRTIHGSEWASKWNPPGSVKAFVMLSMACLVVFLGAH